MPDNMTQDVARAIQVSLEAQLFGEEITFDNETTGKALDYMAIARAAILAMSNYEPMIETEVTFYDN